MSSKPVILVLVLGSLFAVHGLLQPVERGLRTRAEAEPVQTEQLITSAGHGGTMALLGGMRSMVASGCWLRANVAWERKDPVETAALIDLTVAADERPLYFWLNGARILANDLPEWRMAGPVPRAYRAIANEEQAQQALRFLEKGVRWHGADPAFYVEMANIHLRRRGDMETAARYYRLAAEQPGAPHYAARIHGELLKELHRPVEALAWLRHTLAVLPVNDDLVGRDVLIERIALLEHELLVH